MLVSVSRWASKVNSCHRDQHSRLGREQALGETSLLVSSSLHHLRSEFPSQFENSRAAVDV